MKYSSISMTDLAAAAARIRAAENILLITHINPDGDALGSICFMVEWLSALGIRHTAYTAGPLPSTLSFLPNYFSITTDKESFDLGTFDLIISLDCGAVSRTNLAPEIAARREDQFFLEIDHHPPVETVSDLAIRLVEAASTTEILYELAREAKLELTPEMSRCLLTGISTDTANFMFSVTSEKTIAAASDMLMSGANLFKIVNQTWRTKQLPDLKLWGLALSRLERNETYNLAYSVLTAEDFASAGSDHEAMSGLPEFMSGLADVAAVMVLYDAGDGTIRGNLRTGREDVDVGALARRLGGGGHRKAAGFSVPGRIIRSKTGWQVES